MTNQTTIQNVKRHNFFMACVELFIPRVFIFSLSSPKRQSTQEILSLGSTLSLTTLGVMSGILSNLFVITQEPYHSYFYAFDKRHKNNILEQCCENYLEQLFQRQYRQDYQQAAKALKEKNTGLGSEDIELYSSYLISKFLTLAGVPEKMTGQVFYLENTEYVESRNNFFCEIEEAIAKHMTQKLNELEPGVLQIVFDTILEASGIEVGARFYLLHHHHTQSFYHLLEKISFHFDSFDIEEAQKFNALLKDKNPDNLDPHYWGTNQHLSYGVLLNEPFVAQIIRQNEVPLEILDYLLLCNQGLEVSQELIEKIEEIKEAKLCLDFLEQSVPFSSASHSLSAKSHNEHRYEKHDTAQANKTPTQDSTVWEENRILALPDYLLASLLHDVEKSGSANESITQNCHGHEDQKEEGKEEESKEEGQGSQTGISQANGAASELPKKIFKI